MTLSDASIKNPVMAWMLFIGITVFGAIAYTGLGVSQMPDVNWPTLSLSINWPGASPDVVETQVTDLVEQAVLGVQGVQEITSQSRRGGSRITITFDLDKNIDVALQEVQAKMTSIGRDLPYDVTPYEIAKNNPDDQPIVTIAFSGNRPLRFIMEYTKDHLNDAFTAVPGVSQVDLSGFLNPSLRVWLDPVKMNKEEITPDDIVNAISSGHQEVPAGFTDNGKRETSLRMLGEAGSDVEFSKIIIPSRRGSTIWKKLHIGDIARVEDGLEDTTRLARTPEGPAVGINIYKQPGSNSVAVAHLVKAKVKELQKILPEGTKLEVRFDTTKFIEDSANDMNFIILLSVILTAIVCWIFLGSFGTALNVSLTIPMSIFGAFFVIKMFGFTLNTFTFLGLSLVIGIVVDDAIMMVENISRHKEEGSSRMDAAMNGSREITFAAIAATVAILAIFLPVIFMKGVVGKYFYQFGITITSAVMISLLGALTLTPMYASQFLSEHHGTASRKPFMDDAMDKMRDGYLKLLKVCLDNRWKVVIVSVILFAVSMVLFAFIKKEFVPSQDQGRLGVTIQVATGSSVSITDAAVRQAEDIIKQRPEVESYFVSVGGSSSSTGSISITMKDKGKRPVDKDLKRQISQKEFGDMLRKQIKKIDGVKTVGIQDPSLSGFSSGKGSPVDFMLIGPDWDKLAELSDNMKDEMDKGGVMVDSDTDYKLGVTEALILPDREKAVRYAVSMQTIGDALNAEYGGIRAGKFTKNGRRYDIMVQLEKKDREDIDNILKIFVRNNQGQLIRLGNVVTVVEKPTVTSITRENRERAIHISANVATGKSQGEALKQVEVLAKKMLPDGYRVAFTGSSSTFRDSFNSLYIALILGIFVAYMVLGAQFNSFVHPLSVLLALPFSLTGAFTALALSGKSLNVYSAIGVILLMGIVKKNSILLVDFTNQKRDGGMDIKNALLTACPIRLRPIVMTSAATIAAAIPPALALGPGAETRVPMAIVVIGGVFFSTVFTLFVVPCAYSLLTVFERNKRLSPGPVKNILKGRNKK